MATKKFSLAALSLAFIFTACGDDNSSSNTEQNISDSEDISVSVDEVSGVTQKGPFLMGSKMQMFEISNGRSLNQTGKSFNGKISNDKGEFKIKGSKLASQYVILEASGYYRNEITGNNSNSELTLLAISNVSDRNTINVNLLTHLEYERVNYLVTEQNLKVDEAKKQAQKEILDIFYIDNTDFSNSEDLNIAGASDEDGALLAISVLLQGDQSESQLSELLTKIAIDMEEDGEWNDEAKKNAIADWAAETVLSGRIATIRSNVEKWQLSSIVPNFEKHINNFWWTNYGLGTCDEKREGEVLQNSNAQSATNGEYFICADGSWRKATDIEKDTYKWLETSKQPNDGDTKYGDVVKTNCYIYEDKVWRSGNETDCSLELRGCTALRQDTVGKGSDKVWHICDAKSWRDATTYEKDTFGWKDSTDGAIKKGNVTDSIYVFDKTAWRATSNAEAKLGGCVSAIADSVGKVDNTYYICKSNTWVKASATEYDTYHWTAGKDGDSKWGSVNTKNCYVFENNVWRSGNASDCSLELRGCTTLRQDTVDKGSDKVWHICDAKSWREATTYEKDTFGWKDSTDGAIKKGNVTDSIYVFDKTAWRAMNNVESKLGRCVGAIADSVGKVDGTYYICKLSKWVEASAIEYDTYQAICSKDGIMFNGNVNTTTKYVCDNSKFRVANKIEVEADSACTSYNRNKYYILPKHEGKNNYSYYKCTEEGWSFTTEKLNQGSMTDLRDGLVYKTIGIKSQMWMAENLNYADEAKYPSMKNKNKCYMNNLDSCEKYGRFYTWAAAIDSIYWANQGKKCGYYKDLNDVECGLPSKVHGICFDGWHLPSEGEWQRLYSTMKENANALQAIGFDIWSKATDEYGFSAYPAGHYAVDFNQNGTFWTSTESSIWAKYWRISENKAGLDMDYVFSTKSVRCVKDEE